MVSSGVDHMVAITVFLVATMLFIGLFNQTIQTAVFYQRHSSTATKASDLLDNILLTPGFPVNWGQTSSIPTSFGLQDPEFGQYTLSPYSLMRLLSSFEPSVYYYKTDSNYNTLSSGLGGGSFFVSTYEGVDYSTVTELMGVRGYYEFQLRITPTLNVFVTRNNLDPLNFKIEVMGPGSSLGGANLDYHLYIMASDASSNQSTEMLSGTTKADQSGVAFLNFPSIAGTIHAYSLIVLARLSGISGVGYNSYGTAEENLIVPLVSNFEERKILLAHYWDISNPSLETTAPLNYDVVFLTFTGDSELRPVQILTNGPTMLVNGAGQPFAELQMPSTVGILLVSYQREDESECGITMMPWGLSALAFPIVFGADPSRQDWVAIDIRQVTVGGIAYQATLAVWSLKGYQVIN